MNRREFLNVLAAAGVSGMAPSTSFAQAEKAAERIYDAPAFGNVSLLHITDCHAQLLPVYFREPNVNLGYRGMTGRAPHLVGQNFLKAFEIPADPQLAYAFTYLDFERYAARLRQGRRLRPSRHTGEADTRRSAPARCCSMAATRGRAPASRCGPTGRTWSTPPRRSASTS